MIEENLNEIINKWKETYFVVNNYRDSKDRFILAELEDVVAQLEEHQMTIQSLMGHKFVNEIRGEVEDWEKKLATIQNVLDEWVGFQR